MIVKLFKLEGRNVVLDKEYIGTINVFNKILRRDRGVGVKGDTQGRLKLKAYAEFAYIFYVCDLTSIPNTEGFTAEKTHEWALENSGLNDIDSNWKIDKDIDDAIEYYKSTQVCTPTLNLLRSVKEGMNSSSDLINVMVKKMNEHIKALTDLDFSDESTDEMIEDPDRPGSFKPNPNSSKKRLSDAIDLQSKVLKLATELPKVFKEVKNLEEQVKLELAEGNGIRGNRTLGNRENPSR